MKPPTPIVIALLALGLLLLPGCVSLDYDLSTVPVPISAKPAPSDAAEVASFSIESKNILWVHGLGGQTMPDVAGLVSVVATGWDRIAGFRVMQTTNVHQWLLTHLSLTLVRMKTVRIEGQLVRDAK